MTKIGVESIVSGFVKLIGCSHYVYKCNFKLGNGVRKGLLIKYPKLSRLVAIPKFLGVNKQIGDSFNFI